MRFPPLPPKTRVLRFLLYGGPLVAWAALTVYGSTAALSYGATYHGLRTVFGFLAPNTNPIDDFSMYQVNEGFRRIAHVVLFGGFTVLTVRVIQWGQPRLKRSAAVTAFALTLLWIATDEIHRHFFATDRHAKPVDWLLDGGGSVLFLAGVYVYFGIKGWERKLSGVPQERVNDVVI